MKKHPLTSPLLETFTGHNGWSINKYFAHCFNCLDSYLDLEIPMESSGESMDKVAGLIDLSDFELVFKSWTTEDYADSLLEDDFEKGRVYKSKTRKLLMKIWLYLDDLKIDFLYDGNDLETEQWVLNTNHHLRKNLGELKKDETATLEVLSVSGGYYSTDDIEIKPLANMDLQAMYNDDFLETHERISKSMEESCAGLILLHGTPGTGKTTYIKHLITTFRDKTFIFVPKDFVHSLLKPGFVPFLLEQKDVVLIIEDAEKVIMSREENNGYSVVSTILQLTDGLFSDYLNIKVICTFNSAIDKIDKALLRKGRLIANYDFKPLAYEKANKLTTDMGFGEVKEDMTLADIFNMDEKGFVETGKEKAIGFKIS